MDRQQLIKIKHEDSKNVICSNSVLLPEFNISFRGKELKKIIEKLEDDDLLKVKIYHDCRASEFKIIKYIEE
jgi:hypothetical protein